MRTTLVNDTMVNCTFVTRPEQSVSDALDYMSEMKIRHLPVMDGIKLVGIVSERDLKAAAASQSGAYLTCGEIMRKDVFVVDRSMALSEVAFGMADGKYGSALVVDEGGRLIGIFTSTDALKMLSRLLGQESIGSVFSH